MEGQTNITSANDDAETDPIASYDFGFTRPGAIGNYVWVDENSDGYQDAGEPGIPNVRVNLYDAAGALVATTSPTATAAICSPTCRRAPTSWAWTRRRCPAGMTQTPPSTCRAPTSATRTRAPAATTTATR